MKKILNFLYSSELTFILLIILGAALGVATFIEEKYDTGTARNLVYQAHWFEVLFVLLTVNLIGHIIRFKMIARKKWGSLIFHLAFVVILIGAGITRWFSFEGTMHIREGASSNTIWLETPYLQIATADDPGQWILDKPFPLRSFGKNEIHAEFTSAAKGNIRFDYQSFIPNAVEKLKTDAGEGKKIAAIQAMVDGKIKNLFLGVGETEEIGDLTIGFEAPGDARTIVFRQTGNEILIQSPVPMIRNSMTTRQADTVAQDSAVAFRGTEFFAIGQTVFMLDSIYPDATTELTAGTAEEQGADAVVIRISGNGKEKQAYVYGGPDYRLQLQEFEFEGMNFRIGYGQKPMTLPFSLELRDFVLDRYAGSMSPSSYASEVTLVDEPNNIRENHRIFMNHVLDYRMYRFFQSSYDRDEKGTILSVNHDYWGTKVTYLGYLLLTVGFILSLLGKDSRFRNLSRQAREIRKLRQAAMVLLLLVVPVMFTMAQQPVAAPVSPEHAMNFGKLQVQSVDGRFEPVHTLAADILHKISRKDNLEIPGKGKMDPTQVLLDMMLHNDFWREQKIILIREKPVRELVGISGKYASFADFFDNNRQYKLKDRVEEAFRKSASRQNSLDKELIRVDERLNVFAMALDGSMLKIFPEQGSSNHRWIAWNEKGAEVPLTGLPIAPGDNLKTDSLNYSGIMITYMQRLSQATSGGNYAEADQALQLLRDIQRNSPSAHLLASDTRVRLEILYNELNIFVVLRNLFGALSIALLLLSFIDNLRTTRNRIITGLLNFFMAILAAGFLYHTFGMALRWYLSGHAPWSNGYEALILIAWSALLAGFTFARYSKITLAATTLLAFFVLMTASHSSYDPQLTNLQPVLKSYWLIIHVATLTISYGFLGLGFILGLMNLLIGLFKTSKNQQRLSLVIDELTKINEMNLIVGLMLATIGTFLGGVWANESWGRYWGWDAKETWALVIVIAYSVVLHMRYVPGMKSSYAFNVGSVIAFASVIMTFVGVNYYLSKGLHSYGAGDTPVFPVWAWGLILSVIALIIISGVHQRSLHPSPPARPPAQ